MNENPYAAPQAPLVDEAAVARRKHARRIVGPPAVGLLVLTGPMIAFLAFYIPGMTYMTISVFAEGNMKGSLLWQLLAVLAIFSLLFVSHTIVFIGAWKMRRLRSRKWARTAAIMSVIPLVSPMFPLGIPFGVWALIVLKRADVQAAFD